MNDAALKTMLLALSVAAAGCKSTPPAPVLKASFGEIESLAQSRIDSAHLPARLAVYLNLKTSDQREREEWLMTALGNGAGRFSKVTRLTDADIDRERGVTRFEQLRTAAARRNASLLAVFEGGEATKETGSVGGSLVSGLALGGLWGYKESELGATVAIRAVIVDPQDSRLYARAQQVEEAVAEFSNSRLYASSKETADQSARDEGWKRALDTVIADLLRQL